MNLGRVKSMKMFPAGALLVGLMAVAACARTATSEPNGGDVVPIKGGTAYAEVVSNTATGEVMVQTFDKDLKTRQPIEQQPITVGSGGNNVELTPHPTDADPAGTCSRFYGQADWARGGGAREGWMQGRATGDRQEFQWQHGWEAGRMQGRMWEDMGAHRRMGPEHGPGGPMHR
jgi:hypothetical protein